jgi:hypothetical protein
MRFFSTIFSSKTFLILRRIQRDIITDVKTSLRKVAFIPVGFEWDLNLLNRFTKKTQIIKIRPVGDELFHADRPKNRLTWRNY